MYGPAAIERRRCRALRRDGLPCRGWATWDDPDQRCLAHAGRTHNGRNPDPFPSSMNRAAYEPCTCRAYEWPHRPGGGLCRWPDPPTHRLDVPAGTRRRY